MYTTKKKGGYMRTDRILKGCILVVIGLSLMLLPSCGDDCPKTAASQSAPTQIAGEYMGILRGPEKGGTYGHTWCLHGSTYVRSSSSESPLVRILDVEGKGISCEDYYKYMNKLNEPQAPVSPRKTK